MRPPILLLVLFSAIALCCMYPFNDWRLAENATLLDEVIAQHKTNPRRRWAHVIGGMSGSDSPLRAWPSNDKNEVQIPICYVSADARTKLSRVVDPAQRRWLDKLGYAGPTFGHRFVGFAEHYDKDGKGELCYTDDHLIDWNPRVPVDTLRINIILGSMAARSSVGYIPATWYNSIGRHRLDIGWMSVGYVEQIAVYVTTHEIGHVLGLFHEHQRQDREQYVHFTCDHLNGYQQAVRQLIPYPGFSIQELCASALWSRNEPWRSLAFIPFDWSMRPFWDEFHVDASGRPDGFEHMWSVLHSKPYDVNSIMHYASTTGAAMTGEELTVYNAPLVKWKDGREGYQAPSQVSGLNAELIMFDAAQGPSDGDAEAIRKLYPWF